MKKNKQALESAAFMFGFALLSFTSACQPAGTSTTGTLFNHLQGIVPPGELTDKYTGMTTAGGWIVHSILTDRGYGIGIAGNPTTGIYHDVTEIQNRIPDNQAGPVIPGHSPGGATLTIPGIFHRLMSPLTSLSPRTVKKGFRAIY